MKLTVSLKLKPSPEKAAALRETLVTANRAADEISRLAWESKTFKQFQLHRLAYKRIREAFGLSAQVTVRLIAKVADTYKLDTRTRRTFKPHGSIAYDDRILSFATDSVSIWTVAGRMRIPFACGDRQSEMLAFRKGESDLVLRDGCFFLCPTVDVTEAKPVEPQSFLGVDAGIVRIASTSDRQSFCGAHLRNFRKRHCRLRRKLQAKGTKSAKRLLKKRSRKERRFAKDVNHCISKQLVETAQRTRRGIALENLKGIRRRIRASKRQRTELNSWAFAQLHTFIQYKAKRAGVAVSVVDARNSSRECRKCGHVDRRNRKSQRVFQCSRCGFTGNADVNAACVIASRAEVNQPNAEVSESSASPLPSGAGN